MTHALAALAILAVLLGACAGTSPVSPPAAKIPVTIAYSDDPSREALLWAITRGKVSSAAIDVTVKFLPLAQIIPAANTRQYDAIEATPLAIPRAPGAEPGFLILSPSLRNNSGTTLVTSRRSGIASPADLRGRTVGVFSLGGTFVFETRYVLTRRYGLNADLRAGEVKFSETPPETVPQLLADGKLDGAVLTQVPLFRLKDSPDLRLLSAVADEYRAASGRRSVSSIVVTYRDRLEGKAEALAELQRLLAASTAYLREHRAEVIADVATSRKIDPAFLEWFFATYDLSAGPPGADDLAEVRAVWEAARALGDIREAPRVEEFVFRVP